MKKIATLILILFFLLALIDGVIQSPWAKEKAFSVLQKNLRESGWDVQIDKIEQTFPTIDLSGVTIIAPEFTLAFGNLKADLSLGRLWKKEIIFSKLIGDNVSWKLTPKSSEEKAPSKASSFLLSIRKFSLTHAEIFDDFFAQISGEFSIQENRKKGMHIKAKGHLHPEFTNPILGTNWDFSGEVLQNPNRTTWAMQQLKANSDLFQIKGSGTIDEIKKQTKASFQVKSDAFSFPHGEGKLFANVEIEKNQDDVAFHTNWRAPFLKIDNYPVENLQGQIESRLVEKNLESTIYAKGTFLGHAWDASVPISWNKKSNFTFSNVKIASPSLSIEGSIQMNSEGILDAEGSFISPQIHELFPSFYGKASGKIRWQTFENTPLVHFDSQITEAHYKEFQAKSVRIYSDLEDPFGSLTGNILCDIEQGQWKNLRLDTATIEMEKEEENWPFQLSCVGSWEHPLEMDLNGFWNYREKNLLISLQDASGSFFNHPLLLPSPAYFSMSPTTFQLRDFMLQVAEATIHAYVDREKDQITASLNIKELPLDFLSLNPLDVDIEGTFNLDVSVQEKGHHLQGDLKASFEHLEMHLLGQNETLNAEGSLQGKFNRDELNLQGSLNVKNAPLVNLDLKLPIHFEIWPPTADLLYDQNVLGRFYFDGRVEEFLDFFDLGTHRLEGNCLCDLKIENTLSHPYVSGSCLFSDGYYQNYFTGTELQNIEAHFNAKKNAFYLTSLSAQDAQKKGSFHAKGKIDLLPKQQFPFLFDLTFSRFNCATFDLITTEADGSIQITGNLAEAIAKGSLDILESDLTIPSRIPKILPDLQVVYKNAKAPPFDFKLPKTAPYPLHLDLNVDAPDGIFISGRGLESEWKGQFHIAGTQTDIATKGKIELIQGNFLFSGRAFKLTAGSLFFSGIPNVPPTLNLAATIQIKDVLITAHLKGTLNNPQITLQSSPPLPMGTIMSYLLFGQDLAEINSFQALQLASSIASIAGDGPGILEQTKKSLGIDRIQIITVPSPSSESGETIALQVGKYVSEGVLVSYSQGAENSSGNISIEVEGKGGLSFILESDQADEQKQGKFTFRWAHTY